MRIAVIGAGLIGARHIELISDSAECSLAAICDALPARAVLAQERGVPFFAKIEQLLEETRPDGVIIATPTDLHAENALACLRRGIVPLIEKPISSDLAQGRRLLNVAQQKGLPMLVGHYRRFNPTLMRVRDAVQNGELGKLIGVNVLWAQQKPDGYFDVAWRTRPGGGPVLINLIHDIDDLRFICGEIESVYAQTSSGVRGHAVEESAAVTLRFESGALGTVFLSDAAPSPWSYESTTFENHDFAHAAENCYFFFGSERSLAFPSLESWSYPDSSAAGWNYPLARTRWTVVGADALTNQLINYCAVLRGDDEPVVSGEEGYRTLAATLAVTESARRNAPVLTRQYR